MKRERSKRPAYVTNDELMDAWRESKEAGSLQPRLAKHIVKLANRFSLSPNFAGYSFREEMVQEAILGLCANWHKFNPDYAIETGKEPNIFAYYTQACYHSFLRVLGAEKTQREIRDELRLDAGLSASWNYSGSDYDSESSSSISSNNSSSD